MLRLRGEVYVSAAGWAGHLPGPGAHPSLRVQMTGYLQEILGICGIMLVKAFGREGAERQRFAATNAELRNLEMRQNLIGQWFGTLMSTLQTAGPALMILFGGSRPRHQR